MIRKAATLMASFGCGVLVTLVLQESVSNRAFAQTNSQGIHLQPLKEKPPAPSPGIHLQPLKEMPWQQQVNDRLARLEQEVQLQAAQLSKLKYSFDNHYHKYPSNTNIPPQLSCAWTAPALKTCTGYYSSWGPVVDPTQAGGAPVGPPQ